MHHRRHEMRVRDLVGLDKPQGFLGVPLVHQQHCDAGIDRDHEIDAQGRGVIQRPRQQRHIRLRIPFCGLVADIGELRHDRPRAAINALGPARGAGRVEHRGARFRRIDIGRALRRDRRLIIVEAVNRSGKGKLQRHLVGRGHSSGGASRKAPRRNQHTRIAVLDDVGDDLGRLVPVHGRQAISGALRGGPYLGELRPVVCEQGDRIARLEPMPAEQPNQLIGAVIELAPCAVAGWRNDRQPVRRPASVDGHGHAEGNELVVAKRVGVSHGRSASVPVAALAALFAAG